MTRRHRSHIKWFNNDSGFGFLHAVDGIEGEVAILHTSITDKLPGERVHLAPGDILSFEIEDVGEGPRAVGVRREGHIIATEEEWRVLAAMVEGGGKLAPMRRDGMYRVTGPCDLDVSPDLVASLLEKRLIEAAVVPGLYQVSLGGKRAHKEREKEMKHV
jgi:cold shock CspA family protein